MSESEKNNLYESECPECGSKELAWHADTKNYGGVQDGRIRMNEVGPIFYLGCEECSETIKVVTGGVVASMLTELQTERTEAIEIARTAIGAIETIYGHAQFCDQCQSFEIAKQCRDELHGFERLNSLENRKEVHE